MEQTTHKPGLTRRGFLRGAAALATAGLLEYLPRVEGGVLSPIHTGLRPTVAYGEEGGASYELIIVGRNSVGIQIVDVDTMDEKGENGIPIADATVKLTSLFGDKHSVQADTIDDGTVILDLTDLAMRKDDGTLIRGRYQCNCELEVNTHSPDARVKLRDFKVGRIHVEGATGMIIGVRRYDASENTSYLESLCFDEWDILYGQTTFTRTFKKVQHKITGHVVGLDKDTDITVEASFDEENEDGTTTHKTMSFTAKAEAAKGYSFEIEEPFLTVDPTSTCYLNAKEVDVAVSWSANGKQFNCPAKILTEMETVKEIKYDGALTPFFNDGSALGSLSIGQRNWPCFDNVDFSIVNFNFPVQLYVAYESLMLSVGNNYEAVDDQTGKPSKDAWLSEPKSSFQERYDHALAQYLHGMDQYSSRQPWTKKDEDGNVVPTNRTFAKKLSIKTMWQVVVGMQWDGFEEDSSGKLPVWRGKAGIGLGVNMSGSFTWNFMAGPVPMFFSIVPGLSIVFAGLFTVTESIDPDARVLDVKSVKWSTLDGSFAINIKLYLKLSLGVGIDGVLCASVNGSLSVPMNIIFGQKKPDKSLPDAHFTAGISFQASIYLQALLFSISIDVWGTRNLPDKEDPFYDNWNNPPFAPVRPKANGPESFVLTSNGRVLTPNGGSFFDRLNPVTNDMMELSHEARVTGFATNNGVSRLAQATVHKDMIPVVVRLDDGTMVTKLVKCEGVNSYTFGTEGILLEGQELGAASIEDGDVATGEQAVKVASAEAEATEAQPAEGVVVQEQSSDTQFADGADAQAQDAEAAASQTQVTEAGAMEAQTVDASSVDTASFEGVTPEVVADASLVGLVAQTTDETAAGGVAGEAPAGEGAQTVEPDADATLEPQAEDEQLTPASNEVEGEETVLTAQEILNMLDGDPFLVGAGFGEEYTYEPVEGKTTGNYCGDEDFELESRGIDGIGDHDGIKPKVDVVIYQDVFSDPRQKIVDINGTPYLFRVTTVDFSKEDPKNPFRSRVVASAFDTNTKTWGTPKVIDYPGRNGLWRKDTYDYDFDIITRTKGDDWNPDVVAVMVITGGMRPQADNTDVYTAFTTPIVSVVMLDANLVSFLSAVKLASDIYKDDRAHMLCVPRIVDGFALENSKGVVAFGFLHRSTSQAQYIMDEVRNDDNDIIVSFGIGQCFVRGNALSVTLNEGARPGVGDLEPSIVTPSMQLDPSTLSMDMVIGGPVGAYDARITLLFNKNKGYDIYSALLPTGGNFTQLEVVHNISSTETLPKITAWPGRGTYLFTRNRADDKTPTAADYRLYAGTFDPLKENQPGLEANPVRVDKNGLKGAAFTVSPSGNYLFYYECFDGDAGYDYDEKTEELVPAQLTLHRIMAARFITGIGNDEDPEMAYEGTFCEDFPFCELGEKIDGFEVMDIQDEDSVFLASQVTDEEHSLAQLRYIKVPNVIAAEIEGFAPLDVFVCAGSTASFQVDIRNHGNLIIGSFDVLLCDPAKGNAERARFSAQTIDHDRILETAQTPRDWAKDLEQTANADGDLLAASDDAVSTTKFEDMIMPGQLMSYKVDFLIPEDWPGEDAKDNKKTVVVKLDKVDGPSLSVFPGSNTSRYLHEGVSGDLAFGLTHVITRPPSPHETKDNPSPEPTPSPEPNAPKKDDKKRDVLPQTGDLVSAIATPLGLALGGVGALLGAYSTRRAQIEREELEAELTESEDEE